MDSASGLETKEKETREVVLSPLLFAARQVLAAQGELQCACGSRDIIPQKTDGKYVRCESCRVITEERKRKAEIAKKRAEDAQERMW